MSAYGYRRPKPEYSRRDRVVIGLMWVIVIAAGLSIPGLMLVGRVQVCRAYFAEITLPACMVTTLPALPARRAP